MNRCSMCKKPSLILHKRKSAGVAGAFCEDCLKILKRKKIMLRQGEKP